MAKKVTKTKSSLDKNIFESYKKVIDSCVKAGKDVTRLMDRLNFLITSNQ